MVDRFVFYHDEGEKDDIGDWVSYEDYQLLESKLDRLRTERDAQAKEIARLRGVLDKIADPFAPVDYTFAEIQKMTIDTLKVP